MFLRCCQQKHECNYTSDKYWLTLMYLFIQTKILARKLVLFCAFEQVYRIPQSWSGNDDNDGGRSFEAGFSVLNAPFRVSFVLYCLPLKDARDIVYKTSSSSLCLKHFPCSRAHPRVIHFYSVSLYTNSCLHAKEKDELSNKQLLKPFSALEGHRWLAPWLKLRTSTSCLHLYKWWKVQQRP